MKIIFFFIIMIVYIPSFSQKYVLVWSDEFNTPGLPDSTKWSYEKGKIRNNELQYYTLKRMENARIEDTVLILEARKENYEGANYTSASIISKKTGDWKYGKIEIRAKVPTGKGTWPALWMLPTNDEYGDWVKSGEIDIMEYIGVEPQNIYYTAHFEGTIGTGHASSGSGPTNEIQNPWEQFIKFTLIWTPEKIEWYANDVKFHTYTKPANNYRVWPFNKEFYLILNLAYGGTWAGYDGVDDSKLPHQFLIDYLRVYQLQDTEGPYSLSIDPVDGGTIEISPQLEAYPEGTEVTLTAIPDESNSFQYWKYWSRSNPFTFTVNKNTHIAPVFKNKYEMLSNNTFDLSSKPWVFYVDNSKNTTYTAEIVNGQFEIDITKSPRIDWQFGFQELGIPLKKGSYILTFDAFGDEAKSLLISISKNYPDYGSFVSKNVSISTSLKSFEIPLEMPVDNDNTRLYFGLGNFLGKFTIDNISLMSKSDPTTNILENRDINNDWLIHPNPASNSVKIVYQGVEQIKERKIQIHSIDGKLVVEKTIENNITNINTSNLNSGTYIISINNNHTIYTKQLIINN